MKRKKLFIMILAIAAAVCMIFGLVACGDSKDQDEASALLRAYEKAQELGYDGSFEEFVILMKGGKGEKGDPGEKGDKGNPGQDGQSGADGKDGVDGKDGADGKDGIDGANGKDGTDGKDGKDGTDGIDGQDGEKGENGQDGISIDYAYIDDRGHLILVLTDGREIDAGKVTPGEDLPTEGLGYTETTKGGEKAYLVAGMGASKARDIAVPAEHDGAPVIGIDSEAFRENSEIRSVFLPDSVEVIGENAFAGCKNLKRVSFGKDVAQISTQAFVNCDMLSAMEYAGTKEQWNAIEKGDHWDCGLIEDELVLRSYTVHCTDGTLRFPVELEFTETRTAEGRHAYVVSGIGAVTDTHIVIPAEYKGFPVIGIADSAFWNMKERVTSVYIPKSVTKIGQEAFGYTNLETLTLPDSVTEIGSYAFAFTNLKSLTLPDSMTKIGGWAFAGIAVEDLVIPNVEIGTNAFRQCPELRTVTLGDGITSLGYGAFMNCEKLTTVTGGTALEEIDEYSFYGCESLETIELPQGLKEIGYRAFELCTALKSLTLPDSLTKIGYRAFWRAGIENLVIPSGEIEKFAFLECPNLESVTLGDGVTRIGEIAFAYCRALKRVTGGAGLEEVEEFAFEDCTKLESVDFSRSIALKVIGDDVFCQCSALNNVILPDSITEIGSGAFGHCETPLIISYYGTEAQWREISLGSSWNYKAPLITVHCLVDGKEIIYHYE